MLNKPIVILTIAISLMPLAATASQLPEGFVQFKYQPAPQRYHADANSKPEEIYNPDLSTADDDVMNHPDMNIDL